MAGRFSVEAVFKAVDKMSAPVSRMQNRIQKFSRNSVIALKKVDRVSGMMANGLKRAAVAITAAMAISSVAMADVISTGASFEQAITNVGAVGLKTRAQIAPLEKMALQLGKTTKFTATEAANAMEVLARAGFDVNQIMEATPAVLSAAAASGLEIAEVSNHVSNVLKGMGLEMSEAAKVADVLALASSRTNSSIGSLGESMKNVSSTARQLGIPLEDAVASVALLQDVGLDASVAGSAFNVMLTKMAAPSTKITKIMKKLGVSFKDSKGDMKALPSVISEISKASKKMGGNFDQVAFLAELVGLRGQKAASNLAALFDSGKLEKLTEELKKAKGSADEMAKLRMNTLEGSLTLLGSAVDGLKVKIFGLKSGALKGMVDSMTAWVSANEDLIATRADEFFTTIIDKLEDIVKWVKRVAIGIGIFMAFTIVLKAFVLVMTAINLVMAANPIVLAILGIIAAVAVLVPLLNWLGKTFKRVFDGLPMWAKVAVALVMGPIAWLILLPKIIMDNWDGIKSFFSELWDGVVKEFTSAIESIKSMWDSLKSFFGIGLTVKTGFGKAGEGTGDHTQEMIGNAPQIRTPQDRLARTIETSSVNKSEVTIKDETGRAEVTKGKLGNGLMMQPSGAF